MSKRVDLSRRKVLGAIGTVGVASAGAGLGTSAYFSDTENFSGNTMTSGELDLLVDWEEHYSDWSSNENDDLVTELMNEVNDTENDTDGDGVDDEQDTNGTQTGLLDNDAGYDFPVFMIDPPGDSTQVPSGYTGVPTADNPLLAVPDEYVDDFQRSTAIEAFPDTNTNGDKNDGIQDEIPTDNECQYIKSKLRDSNGKWISPLNSTARTHGVTLNGQTTTLKEPLVNISDVKPGDFGEVTFSLHLCDNPGYIWVNGELGKNLENGLTEPEANDPDEDDSPNDNDADVGELGDEIHVALWYDTGPDGKFDEDVEPTEGDNIAQSEERYIVRAGSLNQVFSGPLSTGRGIPLDGKVVEGGGTELGGGVQAPETGTVVSNVDASNSTLIDCTEMDGQLDCSDIKDANENGLLRARKFDRGEMQKGTYNSPAGTVTVESVDVEGGTVKLSTDFAVAAVMLKGGPEENVCKANGNDNDTPLEPGDDVGLDSVTFHTPTKDDSGKSYGLSHFEICYRPGDSDGGGGGGGGGAQNGDDDRDCFPNSTTAYVGLAWWLPVDHANEIQSDSVSFDVGFYTEQCRHNDGSGQTPEGG